MGNIGPDISREEMRQQYHKATEIIHEQTSKIEMYEKAFSLIVHHLASGDEMRALAQEMLEGETELLEMALGVQKEKSDE